MRFSDLSDLYQDFSGTPVTEVGQPVGLVLDKSQSQTLGEELIVNGRFDASSDGWIDVNGDAAYSFYRATLILSSGELTQSAVTEADKVYLFDANVTSTNEEGTVEFKLGTTPGGSEICNIDISGSTRLHRHFVAPGDTTYVTLNNPDSMPSAPISSLFASGEEGAWYDPSDDSTVFQDWRATNPATVGDPVGVIFDKSKQSSWIDVSGETWVKTQGDGVVTVSGNQITISDATTTTYVTRVGGNIPFAKGNALMIIQADYTAASGVKAWLRGAPAPLTNGVQTTLGVTLRNSSFERLDVLSGTVTFTISEFKYWEGNHAIQTTSTARPILQNSGDLWYLDFDGVDDEMVLASPLASSTTFSISQETSDPMYMIASDAIRSRWVWVANSNSSDGGAIGTQIGTPTYRVDGTTETPVNRTDLYNLGNGKHVITMESIDTVGMSEWEIYGYGSSYAANANMYGMILVDRTLTSDEIDLVESYLASKSGVSGFPEYTTEDPVANTFDNISLREVAGFHAKQPTSTARPTLAQTGSYYYLDFDKVDDRLLIDVPGQVSGTAVISDVRGTAAYGVAIPSGTFAVGTNSLSVNFSFNDDLFGMLVRNVAMSGTEIDLAFQYFRDNGATLVGPDAYGDTTSFLRFWRDATWITEFPLIDTSQANTFEAAWYNCTNLKSFPLIDTSQATNLSYAWFNCNSLSSFPAINTSQVTNFQDTWRGCSNLSNFPLIDVTNASILYRTWYQCTSLSSFPQIDTSDVASLNQTWYQCSNLKSFPLIDTSKVVSFYLTWNRCQSLSSFPAINTSSAGGLNYAWEWCQNLSSFPQIDTSKVTGFAKTWKSCRSLSSFPQIDCRAATDLFQTWFDCINLEYFPSGVFDNTSGTVNFTSTFQDTKLNTQSIDNVLLSVNTANTSNGTINLNYTNMQSPGVGGTYAKHRLESRGWTVNTKPVSDDVIVSSIFYTGQYGTWYDVNDLDTLFEDANGTIPVTAAGQPVGLMLDKSQGLVLGEELVTNGTFDVDTSGWVLDPWYASTGQTLEWQAGEAKIISGGSRALIKQSIATTIGKTYQINYTISAPSGGLPTFRVFAAESFAYTPITYNGDLKSGNQTAVFKATESTHWIYAGLISVGPSGTYALLDNVSIKELPGNHAYQNTSTARPILQGSAGDYHLDYDQVDDRLLVDVSGFNGTAYIPTEEGSVAYGVAIPSGTYALGTNTTGVTYSFAKELVGGIITDTPMISPEIGGLDQYFAARGAGPYGASAYGGNTSLYQYWRNADWITEFPLIDTSQVATFRDSWSYCYSLRSFPQVNSSAVTSLWSSWAKCHSLSSFPLIDTSQVTDFMEAWGQCYNLSSFPLIDTSKGTRFQQAWWTCSSLTSFPAINTSAGTNFTQTWNGCTNLTDFPLIDTSQALAIDRTWSNCYSLTSFPAINTSAATHFNQAWYNCTSLTDFPLIDTGQATSLFQTWNGCNSLTDFPLIDTKNVTTMQYAWQNCTSLTSFPAINTSAVGNFELTWWNCISLSSFPQIDCRSATKMYSAWKSCSNLEHFPAGVFDNTSGTSNFTETFYGTKLNTQSIDNVLVSVNNANTSNGTIRLHQGNQQPPSYWGVAASGALTDRGWTVNTKTPTAEAQLDSTIAPMFFSGDVGAWYDPSDFDTMFEAPNSNTFPVTGAGQPVGLILDKSKGLQLSNELIGDTWSFNDAGWSQVGDTLVSVSGGQFGVYQLILETGKAYSISFEVFDYESGAVRPRLGSQAEPIGPPYITANGVYTATCICKGSTAFYFMGNLSFVGKIRNISVRELPGNHAYQETSTARPVLAVDASGKYFLDSDGVDDFLQATMPEVIGKKIVASPEGIVEYGVNIPAGSHPILRNNAAYTFYAHPDTYGEITSTNPFDTSISSTVIQYFADKGAGPSGVNAFSGTTTLSMRWRQNQWITDFPLIDTSQVASFYYAWEQCLNLSSFPAINTSQATNIQSAWLNCQSLISMPQIDTSKVTTMTGAWNQCYNLTSFPQIETSALLPTGLASAWRLCRSMISFPFIETGHITNFGSCWQDCFVLSSFPLIDTSQGTNFNYTWRSNRALSSFPLIDTGSATSLFNTWNDCTNLSSFPAINTSAVTNFTGAWPYCRSLSSFPLIDTSQGVTFAATWNNCISLTSFPQIDTSQGTDFGYAWSYCNNLKEFPQLNLSAATNLTAAWHSNSNLSSFPQIDCRSATNLNLTWYNCSKLEVFPSGVFDNTSGTTDFSTTFLLTKLNTQSIDNVLLSVNKANTSDGTITLNSTNMQTPGVGGTYAKHQLENRGWTVNTKAVTNDVVVSSVFFEGESAWYDVNDLTTLYQDSNGTTPVTAAGQPVGLMLDKSQGLVLGEENVVNGTFDSGLTGWGSGGFGSATLDSGGARIERDAVLNTALVQALVFEIGKFYQITYDVVSGSQNTGPSLLIVGKNADSVTGSYSLIYYATTTTFEARCYIGNFAILDNISAKEIPGNHAVQTTSTARPVLQGSAGDYYLDFDGVDDRLLVDSPGFTGTAYIADELGSAAYGVAIPSGTYTIGRNDPDLVYTFAKDIVGQVLLDRPLLDPELGALQTYFDDLGAGPYGASAYGGATIMLQYWRDAGWITDFPLIDTSQVTQMNSTWMNCTGLTSFPLIDTSQVTNMTYAWHGCTNLSSFPLIDTSQVTNIANTWENCNSLISFPVIDTSKATNFYRTWYYNTSLTSFPEINTSAATSFQQAWYSCTSLSSFPLIDTGNVTVFREAWGDCQSLSSFPLIDTSQGGDFYATWRFCNSLSSFPVIDMSVAWRLQNTWDGCYNLTSFPTLNTSSVTDMRYTWKNCYGLTSFPLIDTQSVTSLQQAWYSCYGLETFPLLNTASVQSINNAWFNCNKLTTFPAINTSAVSGTGFQQSWRYCTGLSSFPWIDTSKGENFQLTWERLYSISSFPALDFGSATSLDRTWRDCVNLEHFPAGLFDNTSGTTDFSTTFQQTKLNQQSVDNVIVSVNNANTSAGTLNLTWNNFGMQPPSYWGIVASGLLEDRGWAVDTVTPTTQALEDSEIASLFFSGDEGAWYDPSDFTTMFEDYQGTIPVTGTSQPVGLILDKSKGLQLGNNVVGNGNFDTSSGWNVFSDWVISGGVAQNTTGGTSILQPNVATLTVGKWYKVTFDLVATAGRTFFRPHAAATAGQIEYTTPGTKTAVFQATVEFFGFRELSGSAGTIIDNVVIQELPGNHAYQQTSTARPLLQVDASSNYYLDFDGVDDYLTAGDKLDLLTNDLNGFAATKADNNLDYSVAYAKAYYGSIASRYGLITNNTSDNLLGLYQDPGLATYNVEYANFVPSQTSIAAQLLNRSAGEHILRVDGVNEASSTFTPNSTSMDSGFSFLIGAYNDAESGGVNPIFYKNGRIYGVVLIHRSLNSTEIDTVESYLAAKSGVTL